MNEREGDTSGERIQEGRGKTEGSQTGGVKKVGNPFHEILLDREARQRGGEGSPARLL